MEPVGIIDEIPDRNPRFHSIPYGIVYLHIGERLVSALPLKPLVGGVSVPDRCRTSGFYPHGWLATLATRSSTVELPRGSVSDLGLRRNAVGV